MAKATAGLGAGIGQVGLAEAAHLEYELALIERRRCVNGKSVELVPSLAEGGDGAAAEAKAKAESGARVRDGAGDDNSTLDSSATRLGVGVNTSDPKLIMDQVQRRLQDAALAADAAQIGGSEKRLQLRCRLELACMDFESGKVGGRWSVVVRGQLSVVVRGQLSVVVRGQ